MLTAPTQQRQKQGEQKDQNTPAATRLWCGDLYYTIHRYTTAGMETGKVYIEFENHSSGLFSVKGILTWFDNILAYKAVA